MEGLVLSENVYHAYGEGARMFGWLDGSIKPPREAIFEGVAGCGKTRMIGEWIKALCGTFPNSKGLVIRETRVSLNDSFLAIWEEEVLGPGHPAVLGGATREHRDRYHHPALGGEVILGGMDRPTKLFSTQYDWVYFNECQETQKGKWESLHRALGRRRSMPFSILLGDCNPEDEYHWANRRMIAGVCDRIIGRFWDNPLFYNHERGEWTEQGMDYLQRLKNNLSGVRLQRLFYGKWVSASGQVWENYDAQVHVIKGKFYKESGRYYIDVPDQDEPIELTWFLGGQDMGHTAPGCAMVAGFDRDGRMYILSEIYWTRQDHEWWAERWAELYQKYPVKAIVCDHDKAFIASLNKRLEKVSGIPSIARPAEKNRAAGDVEMAGIDDVRVRFKQRPDGTCGLYILENTLEYGRDSTLVMEEKPTCLREEIPSYVYCEIEEGKKIKDQPDPACADHACDTLRYMCRWAGDKSLGRREPKLFFPRGSVNDQLGLNKWLRRHGWRT